jgi:hypothetical protein
LAAESMFGTTSKITHGSFKTCVRVGHSYGSSPMAMNRRHLNANANCHGQDLATTPKSACIATGTLCPVKRAPNGNSCRCVSKEKKEGTLGRFTLADAWWGARPVGLVLAPGFRAAGAGGGTGALTITRWSDNQVLRRHAGLNQVENSRGVGANAAGSPYHCQDQR